MYNYIGHIFPWIVILQCQSFRILGPDLQYSWNVHFWKLCNQHDVFGTHNSSIMPILGTVAGILQPREECLETQNHVLELLIVVSNHPVPLPCWVQHLTVVQLRLLFQLLFALISVSYYYFLSTRLTHQSLRCWNELT